MCLWADWGNVPSEELDAINFENVIRDAQKINLRNTFAKKSILNILTLPSLYNPNNNTNLKAKN